MAQKSKRRTNKRNIRKRQREDGGDKRIKLLTCWLTRQELVLVNEAIKKANVTKSFWMRSGLIANAAATLGRQLAP